MNETQKQIRSTPQAGGPLCQHVMHLEHVGRRGIGKPGFHSPMTVLFGIKFRRVLRQGFHDDLGMVEQEAQGFLAGMNRGMITDENEASGEIAQYMLQAQDHIWALHATRERVGADVTRQRQSYGGRQHAAVTGDTVDHWSLAAGRPWAPQTLHERASKFIEKHDVNATSLRLFLSVANRVPARLGSPPRLAPLLGLAVVADSSPVAATGVEYA